MAATEEKKYLINVESNLDEYTKDVQESTKAVDEWKKKQKEAEQQFGKNSDEYIQATAQLKVAQKEQRQATSTLEKMTAAQKANGTSYNDLYKQWVAAEAQLKSLDGTVQRNADGTITLSDAYKKAKVESERAKAAVDQFNLGVNNGTTSVGQYSKGITDAMRQTGLFGGAFNVIGDVKSKFTGAVDGVKKFASSFSTVKAAIASTGIGLLIIAIGSLVTWFKKTAEGGKLMKQAMAAVGEVFNTLVGTLIKTGSLLKNLVTLNFKGMRDDVKAIGDQWRNVGNNVRTAINLVTLEAKLAKDKRDFLIEEAKLQKNIAVARLNSADVTKKSTERVNELKKAVQGENDLAKERVKLINDELKIAQQKLDLELSKGEKASEEKQRVAELTAESIKAETEYFNKSKEMAGQISAFQKEIAQKAFNDKKTRLEAEAILAEGNYQKTRKNLIDMYNLEITQADLTRNQKYLLRAQLDKSLRELDKEYAADTKNQEKEYLDFLEQINAEVLASDAKLNEDLKAQRASDASDRTETKRIEADGDLYILSDILDEEYSALIQSEEYKASSDARKALLDAQYADQKKKIGQDIADYEIALDQKVLAQKQQTFEATADLLGATAELMGKNTLIGKSLAIAQATINTYLAASKALASAPNPVVGAIMAAAAIAMGLVQVKQIMAVKVSKTGGSAGAPSGGGGKTVSSSFTAANQQIAQSQTQNANADRLGTIQQNVNNQTALAQTAQATSQPQKVEVALSVEAFESQAAKKNQVEVKSNI